MVFNDVYWLNGIYNKLLGFSGFILGFKIRYRWLGRWYVRLYDVFLGSLKWFIENYCIIIVISLRFFWIWEDILVSNRMINKWGFNILFFVVNRLYIEGREVIVLGYWYRLSKDNVKVKL